MYSNKVLEMITSQMLVVQEMSIFRSISYLGAAVVINGLVLYCAGSFLPQASVSTSVSKYGTPVCSS